MTPEETFRELLGLGKAWHVVQAPLEASSSTSISKIKEDGRVVAGGKHARRHPDDLLSDGAADARGSTVESVVDFATIETTRVDRMESCLGKWHRVMPFW
jgi:hypothetical protein